MAAAMCMKTVSTLRNRWQWLTERGLPGGGWGGAGGKHAAGCDLFKNLWLLIFFFVRTAEQEEQETSGRDWFNFLTRAM